MSDPAHYCLIDSDPAGNLFCIVCEPDRERMSEEDRANAPKFDPAKYGLSMVVVRIEPKLLDGGDGPAAKRNAETDQ